MIETGASPAEEDRLSFSLSDEEVDETTDSLDIKPPQAAALDRKSRPRKEKGHKDSKQDHKRSSHSLSSRSGDRRKDHRADRSQSLRERDYQQYPSKDTHRHSEHHSRARDRGDGREHSRSKREAEDKGERNTSEKRLREATTTYDMRVSLGEEQLEDLRGKLLEKRNQREVRHGSEPDRKRQKKEKRSERMREVELQPPAPPPETEEERVERLKKEERRSKLLEAEREMAMRKEVSRRELEARRERHNLEKEKNRMLKEIAKKHRQDGEKSDGEADDTESDDDSDDSSTTTSSDSKDSSDDTTEGEERMKTPESAPPLEKSPMHTPKRTESISSHEGTPELDHDDIKKDDSDDRMDVINEEAYEAKSPEPEIILKEDTLPPYLPALQGCRSVEEFQCLNRIEEGTYGVVYRARDKRTSDIVALKRLKMEKEKEGFPITSLREINTLLKAQHPNIVTVREIVVGSNMDKIFIVMDYVEHDLKSLMETMKSKKQVFLPGEIKCLMMQLLRAVAHLHDNWILHRDLKTSNLLLSHKGILKVGDFGLAREYGSPKKNYTPIVVTLWYRAPELLLQAKEYTTAIDVWSVGCIFGELLQMSALFNGTSEMNQLNKIFKELGTPNEKTWPGCSKLPAFQKVTFADFPVNQIKTRFGSMLTDLGLHIINAFLTYDPEQRITAEEALKHSYFKEVPLPIDPAMFPTWPAKSEQGVKKANNSPKPPSGGKAYKQLGDEDDEMPSGGFHMGAAERRINVPGPGFSLKF